ncbi:putative myst histone acetyltransferase [Rhizoctonia solani 123E]|uniref:histone acetyltransferase n=1 Tax=Rhizoctonia solani 123E TaxID=1423351 RepID=A0A074SHI1_9AGAM|nr:putative myst histone acetyltransferase [Rhizoctonia solani 123E]
MAMNSLCWVLCNGDQALRATIIQQRGSEYYVHYEGRDKRLDEWVPTSAVRLDNDSTGQANETDLDSQDGSRAKKRNRTTGPSLAHSDGTPATTQDDEVNSPATLPSTLGPSIHTRDQTEAAQQHIALTAQRNFDRVNFDQWHIKTWYYSPYPSFEDDADTHTRPRATPEGPAVVTQGGAHATTHLPTGGATPAANHTTAAAESTSSGDATLWVCDRCFKYMREATAWELHKKTCKIMHPPGRKVYQRGAHTIWEVDGQVERLYCQNLSLFGKLFIDVKTLFFDTEHFMFYILTDADAHRDHFLAYFSQEKISYDDYNLACIVTLPPYQKRGYGMLLIEFSYELSRRAGKLGTPERPLSDLGLRSYVSFWISVLVRFFRTITPLPVEDEQEYPGSQIGANSETALGHNPTISEAGSAPIPSSSSPSRPDHRPSQQRHEPLDSGIKQAGPAVERGRILHSQSALVDTFGDIAYHTRSESKGPSNSGVKHRTVRCGLEDIAHATHLRPDDIALALREAGLLIQRRSAQPNPIELAGEPSDSSRHMASENTLNGAHDTKHQSEVQIVITHEMIERVARERKVKPPYLDRAYVLL